MTAITYNPDVAGQAVPAAAQKIAPKAAPKVALKTAEAAPARPGFWARVWDAIVKARMQEAMREIRMHSHLLPKDVQIVRNGLRYRSEDPTAFLGNG